MLETNFPKSKNVSQYGISVNRKAFDEQLIQNAKDCGVSILFNKTITKIEEGPSFWSLKDLKNNQYKSRLLIGADGKRSFVSKILGLNLELKRSRVAIHCWKTLDQEIERKGQMHILSDGSYIGLDPTGPHEINISLVCDPKAIKNNGGQIATLNKYLNESSFLKEFIGSLDKDQRIFTVSPVSHKVKKGIYNNAALIGDAQGFTDPLTGEGIFNALWTARALAQEIILHPHGGFDYSRALKR